MHFGVAQLTLQLGILLTQTMYRTHLLVLVAQGLRFHVQTQLIRVLLVVAVPFLLLALPHVLGQTPHAQTLLIHALLGVVL